MHTVKWFQELLYNSHKLTSVIGLHTVSSIWHIDRALSGTTTPGQSESGSNGNKRVLHISLISKVGASLSDGLTSYLGHLLGVGLVNWSRVILCIEVKELHSLYVHIFFFV